MTSSTSPHGHKLPALTSGKHDNSMEGTQPDEICVVLKLPTLTSGTLGNSMEGTQSDDNAWCSRLSQELKVNLFLATVESVLMYGCEAWTMTAN